LQHRRVRGRFRYAESEKLYCLLFRSLAFFYLLFIL
jgi:hypothetical protein